MVTVKRIGLAATASSGISFKMIIKYIKIAVSQKQYMHKPKVLKQRYI